MLTFITELKKVKIGDTEYDTFAEAWDSFKDEDSQDITIEILEDCVIDDTNYSVQNKVVLTSPTGAVLSVQENATTATMFSIGNKGGRSLAIKNLKVDGNGFINTFVASDYNFYLQSGAELYNFSGTLQTGRRFEMESGSVIRDCTTSNDYLINAGQSSRLSGGTIKNCTAGKAVINYGGDWINITMTDNSPYDVYAPYGIKFDANKEIPNISSILLPAGKTINKAITDEKIGDLTIAKVYVEGIETVVGNSIMNEDQTAKGIELLNEGYSLADDGTITRNKEGIEATGVDDLMNDGTSFNITQYSEPQNVVGSLMIYVAEYDAEGRMLCVETKEYTGTQEYNYTKTNDNAADIKVFIFDDDVKPYLTVVD